MRWSAWPKAVWGSRFPACSAASFPKTAARSSSISRPIRAPEPTLRGRGSPRRRGQRRPVAAAARPHPLPGRPAHPARRVARRRHRSQARHRGVDPPARRALPEREDGHVRLAAGRCRARAEQPAVGGDRTGRAAAADGRRSGGARPRRPHPQGDRALRAHRAHLSRPGAPTSPRAGAGENQRTWSRWRWSCWPSSCERPTST